MDLEKFVNEIFDVCAKASFVSVHYTLDENGLRIWKDKLHNIIQGCSLEMWNALHCRENYSSEEKQ